jgi:GT2 family glycosyltransferase/glycosyltransferase involved in cell wall biosynthesis
LASVYASLAGVSEPNQVIVVANGAPRETYAGLVAGFPDVEWVHDDVPLGFSTAIARGLEHVRHDWTFLMNNDVTVEPATLPLLAKRREADVFAIAAQIVQKSADGRREETGFVDWYIGPAGLHVAHVDPGDGTADRPHLAGSGGATLFRTEPLRRYAAESRCYDPFYWEDIEWGLRAWQEGWRVIYCPTARVRHRHQATTSRFYGRAEVARIAERNRRLFDCRNAATDSTAADMLNGVCTLSYTSQRELSQPWFALGVLVQRWKARHLPGLPTPPSFVPREGNAVEIVPVSFSYRLRAGPAAAAESRPRVLLVSPFGVFPPLHGGARRIAGLVRALRESFDIILISDEAREYDGRSLAYFDGLYAIHLVQRSDRPGADRRPLRERMRTHAHGAMINTLDMAVRRYQPAIVQIEHLELADLVVDKGPGPRWILGLHDAFADSDFEGPGEARRFVDEVLPHYDAVTVCSPEDATLIHHRKTVCVPNGTSLSPDDYRPSASTQLLFMGPFRYRQNREGIQEFLRIAYPAIRRAVPGASLLILGGNDARAAAAEDPLFSQPGVEVMASREDVAALLGECALTINPLRGIRGSAIKVIESLTVGRVCVSTVEGARGFLDLRLPGLVTVSSIDAMIEPIVRLLRDPEARRRLESPDRRQLAPFRWEHNARLQAALYLEMIR